MRSPSAGLVPLVLLLPLHSVAATCPLASFGPGQSLPVEGSVDRLLTADVNRDGLPDLLAFGDARLTVLLARTSGGLTDPIVSLLPSGFRAEVLRDVDGDGRPDLAGIAGGAIALLRGDGAGGFAPLDAPAAPASVQMLTAGDFDGDGRVDLLVFAGSQTLPSNTAFVYPGAGAGAFGPPRAVTLPGRYLEIGLGSLVTGDLDGDGIDDVVLFPWRGDVRVLFGGRDGFRAGQDLYLGYYPLSVLLADLDRDGALDIVGSGNPKVGSSTLVVYLNDGHGVVRQTVQRNLRPGVSPPAVADFDGDGHLDVAIVASRYGGLATTVLLAGDGAGGFGPETPFSSLEPAALAALDADRDGHADLVVASASEAALFPKTCVAGTESATLIVPFVLSAVGAPGTLYRSDLLLADTGTASCGVRLSYTAAIGGPSGSGTMPLAGGEQRYEPSALGFLSQLVNTPIAGGGTLRLQFDGVESARDASVLVRTTNGGAGVAYPGIPLADALRGTSIVGWLREDARDRTNLALVNVGAVEDGDVVLRVTLTSTDDASHGRSVTLPDVVLHPGGFFQTNRVLSTSDLGSVTAVARIERLSGQAPYLAYAVVNDEVTSDGSIVFAQAQPDITAAGGLVVPAVVETGGYETELLLTNVATSPRRIHLEYVASAIDAPSHAAVLDLDLAPGEHRAIPSFVDELRRRGVSGIGPRGGAFAGALFLSVPDGPSDGVFAGARVLSPSPGGGRYGVFVPAARVSAAASAGAVVPGLRQDASVRSNLALVNLGDGTTAEDVFEIDLFDGETRGRVATIPDVRVPSRGWKQLGSILATHAPGTAQGYARIRRVDGDGSFLAYGVVNDGAGPGLGTGDGSYVPMRSELAPPAATAPIRSRR